MKTFGMRKNRKGYDTGTDISRAGRAAYIKAVKGMGFYDICECDWVEEQEIPVPFRVRPDTGVIGQKECIYCAHLIWPLSSIYECDACAEPTLSDTYPVSEDELFLCQDCQ
jgi:hypothetical protein